MERNVANVAGEKKMERNVANVAGEKKWREMLLSTAYTST